MTKQLYLERKEIGLYSTSKITHGTKLIDSEFESDGGLIKV